MSVEISGNSSNDSQDEGNNNAADSAQGRKRAPENSKGAERKMAPNQSMLNEATVSLEYARCTLGCSLSQDAFLFAHCCDCNVLSDALCNLLQWQAIAIYKAKRQHTARDSLSRQLASDHCITAKSVRGELLD